MVVKGDFEVGDLVWAKMKGFPPWPAKIAEPPSDKKAPPKKHYVYFFGSKNFAWILDELISPHTDKMLEDSPKKKPSQYQTAVDEIIEASKSFVPRTKPTKKVEDKAPTKPKLLSQVLPKQKKSSAQKKLSAALKVARAADKASTQGPLKRNLLVKRAPKKIRKIYDPIDDESRVGVIKPFSSHLPYEFNDKNHVIPTSKKIGFLGLGMIGRGIVKNLIRSGHQVTVWNRTPEKCELFVRHGALKGQTPADVVQACDIVFSCVADPAAAKALVFSSMGVLAGLRGSKGGEKGYVEMTTLNAEVSVELSEAITMTGARYLEAPLQGTTALAEEGKLLILGAGDRSLFIDCETCFHAIARHTYYISCDVGRSSKLSLIYRMLLGTVQAITAETITLLERLKLPQREFLKICVDNGILSEYIAGKGRDIVRKNFAPFVPLKYVQKDMQLAMLLGDSTNHAMLVNSAANELYKHARLLGYAEHDVSAVYNAVKY